MRIIKLFFLSISLSLISSVCFSDTLDIKDLNSEYEIVLEKSDYWVFRFNRQKEFVLRLKILVEENRQEEIDEYQLQDDIDEMKM